MKIFREYLKIFGNIFPPVPFLSIPLNSINSLIGGNFADIGNFLNFGDLDIGSIATVAVIGIAAIFVLPQAIYWITGINLSTFNWGRSEGDLPGKIFSMETEIFSWKLKYF